MGIQDNKLQCDEWRSHFAFHLQPEEAQCVKRGVKAATVWRVDCVDTSYGAGDAVGAVLPPPARPTPSSSSSSRRWSGRRRSPTGATPSLSLSAKRRHGPALQHTSAVKARFFTPEPAWIWSGFCVWRPERLGGSWARLRAGNFPERRAALLDPSFLIHEHTPCSRAPSLPPPAAG